MRLLINTSTIVETGCTQVCVSFINECIKHTENEYYVLLSNNVAKNINDSVFPNNFHFEHIHTHPLYTFKARHTRRFLRAYEQRIKPDCVFSVFGPSWWTPQAPHLMGYAFPYYVYPDSPYFSIISLRSRLVIYLMKLVHRHFLKRNGSYYVCETEDVSNKLAKLLGVQRNHVFTASNTANAYFMNYTNNKISIPDDEFRFYSLCSPKFHKNLEILNDVIPLLKKMHLRKNVYFYTTCPKDKYDAIFNDDVKPFIRNVGLLPVAECPNLVAQCHALFLPTLMECFSASYPEAMALGKPIITTDLPFATTVCKDAALYFTPLNALEAVKSITELVNSEDTYIRLQQNGKKRLADFLTPSQRAEKYLEILKAISQ